MKKFITIDLWLTLIKSNPAYKSKQIQIIYDYLVRNHEIITGLAIIAEVLSDVNRRFDAFTQETGLHVESETRLLYVIRMLLVIEDEPQEVNRITDLKLLSAKIDECMIANPPLLMDPNIKLRLQELKDLGYTLIVASNTGLQDGVVMREVLKKLEIYDYFDDFLFSNETVYAKPSMEMFTKVLTDCESWFHVGDNNIADNIGYTEDEEDSDWFQCITPAKFRRLDLNDFATVVSIIKQETGVFDTITIVDIDDEQTIALDAIEYSRFKHGSKEVCSKYAEELSSAILLKLKDRQVKNVLIYGAPYNNVPAASNFLVFDMIRELRRLMPTVNFQEGKIQRKNSYHEDYGKLSKEEREKMLEGEDFEFITAYHDADLAIFVDDIYITGTHERLILQLLKDEIFPVPFFMAYYAKVSGGCCEPQYESQLNQAALQTDEGILAILAEDIVINTRNCKYFLRQSSELIKTALERNPNAKIWNELLTKAVANGYSSHELYNVNFNIIQDKCQSL